MRPRYWLLGLLAAATFACGNNSGSGTDANGGGNDPDGGVGETVDAPPFGGMCTQGGDIQCSDCVDNDQDGKIDGLDPECSGPIDDREDSFATGIPGDNIDATMQDCFFDGNSGAGNDGCNQHVCCLLQAADQAECQALAPSSNYGKYKKNECYQPFGNAPVSPKCQMNCGPLAPPGCDCFGCCTVCGNPNDPTTCRDIALNPQISPNCDATNINDPGPDGMIDTADDPCKRCYKTDCGNTECGGQTCILCPGQDPSTLPSSCGGTTCPTGVPECDTDGACPAGSWCSQGCCVGVIL